VQREAAFDGEAAVVRAWLHGRQRLRLGGEGQRLLAICGRWRDATRRNARRQQDACELGSNGSRAHTNLLCQ